MFSYTAEARNGVSEPVIAIIDRAKARGRDVAKEELWHSSFCHTPFSRNESAMETEGIDDEVSILSRL
jgi:hypothetical protein